MASISRSLQPPSHSHLHRNPISFHFSPSILSFLSYRTPFLHSRFCALKTGSDGRRIRSQDAFGSDLLRKPVGSPVDAAGETNEEEEEEEDDGVERNGREKKRRGKKGEDEDWVDWEDQILEDTVPLVGFVRMILHSEKYASGDRLSPEHEKTIVERLLPYHPECENKIGCGIDYITVGYHPDFETSRCMFIVRKDGELVDFSYWKCIKGLIRKNYPLYADSFILRHFRRRRRE